MNVQKDFEELFALFRDHQVEFLIVGGYAVAFHGKPRYTKDIDLLRGAKAVTGRPRSTTSVERT